MQFIDLKAQYQALKNEINENIQAVLDDGRYIGGPQVKELEEKLAAYVGRKHCISCANGTDALQIAYMVYGIGEGDAVFCPDITFISSTEPSKMLGATSVFCDIQPDTYNLCPESLERQIKAVLAEGKLTPKAVVAVDILGNPCDYDAIIPICEKYGLILIEDAAQSFGGSIGEKMAGSFGMAAAVSFFPSKPLGCYGDGGAVFTNDGTAAERIRSLKEHGRGESKYDNLRIGCNSRLDTVQAAGLLAKLAAYKRYERGAAQQVADMYSQKLSTAAMVLPKIPEDFRSAWAQYTVILSGPGERSRLQTALQAKKIPSMVYYPRPLSLQRAYKALQTPGAISERTQWLCDRVLSLPFYPYMTEAEVDSVCRVCREFSRNETVW